MNSTSLDINVSETLANKTLVVTTILVRSSISGPLRTEFWVVRDVTSGHVVICFCQFCCDCSCHGNWQNTERSVIGFWPAKILFKCKRLRTLRNKRWIMLFIPQYLRQVIGIMNSIFISPGQDMLVVGCNSASSFLSHPQQSHDALISVWCRAAGLNLG